MRIKIEPIYIFLLLIIGIIFIQSCSSTKYVPEGEYWLQDATVKSDTKKISSLDMEAYIQQKSNFKTFMLFRLPLFIYNLSGSDTTKWINRVLRSGGEAPVIYDSVMVEKSVEALIKVMENKGYVHASVTPEISQKKNKVKVKYRIHSGTPYMISDYSINIKDTLFQNSLKNPTRQSRRNREDFNINNLLSRNTLVDKESLFDLDMLDEERGRVASIIRRMGYYNFDKEYIGFIADTTSLGENKVGLEMTVYPYMEKRPDGRVVEEKHKQYIVKEVHFYMDFNPVIDGDVNNYNPSNIVQRENGLYKIYYGERGNYIKPHIIMNNCYISAGDLYNENATASTYSALARLPILQNVNINYKEINENDSTALLCIVTCTPSKKQAITIELEGTNSEGDFGVGTSIGYLHRNLFRGSELFNFKIYGTYEELDGSFASFKNNYFEIGGETSITFPRFMFPFLKHDLRRRLQASSQLSVNYTFQRRPGQFTRTILSGRWSYLWQQRHNNSINHAVDLINVSYVHIPKLEHPFADQLTEAAREFSFKDQFIMGAGYTYTNTNFNLFNQRRLSSIYSLRISTETAGNFLSLVAAITDAKKDEFGSKEFFGTRFVQYILGNVDYSRTIPIDEKNTIAWRVGGGLVFPYGNYRMVPIQKRFFAGGANSVRGWGIRELGPGAFHRPGATFYDHSGEVRFDANIEYRSNVFWKIQLAAFVDAGNVWTIKKDNTLLSGQDQDTNNPVWNSYYSNKGYFKLGAFYKQIALSWGLGIRLDFDYVLIRLDCGWKLYNPADVPKRFIEEDGTMVPDLSAGYKSKWPVTRPFDFKHNTAWHIAVGYPF